MSKREGHAFYYAFGCEYGLTTGYQTEIADEWWCPRQRQRGVVGIHLFGSTSQAVRAATQNLVALAAEQGVSVVEMRECLRDVGRLAQARGGLPQHHRLVPLTRPS